MPQPRLFLRAAALAGALFALPSFAAVGYLDGASAEFATGNRTQMARIGVQYGFERKWFVSNETHLSGYWDLSFAEWRGNEYRDMRGATQRLWDIGLTPVFRFERNDRKGWYAEGGIGAHRLSELYDNNDRHLSTLFEFGDHLGAGYVFANDMELGMKLQHFSNGGFKHPNSGVNFLVVKLATRF